MRESGSEIWEEKDGAVEEGEKEGTGVIALQIFIVEKTSAAGDMRRSWQAGGGCCGMLQRCKIVGIDDFGS
jgi:hypothetical protein